MASSGPREGTVRQLFALSMNQCAFPGCKTQIIEPATGTIQAEVCHIIAQNEGGPRYVMQDDEERHGFANLVLMCRNHHKVIDAPENLREFTPERLREIKLAHEIAARRSERVLPDLSAAALAALRLSGTTYESGSTHMDFRHAEFRVGGEGGAFCGGGGSGGILTIVGVGRLPPDVSLDLDGQHGQAPGGGGGGAGALRFLGRAAESGDQRSGLRISSLFAANAVSLNGLLNVLGAGWSFCPVPCVPHSVRLEFAYIVEGGKVAPGTLLRFDLVIRDPSGKAIAAEYLDVEVPDQELLVRRMRCFQRVQFSVDAYGIWAAILKSGDLELASFPFEFRAGEAIQS